MKTLDGLTPAESIDSNLLRTILLKILTELGQLLDVCRGAGDASEEILEGFLVLLGFWRELGDIEGLSIEEVWHIDSGAQTLSDDVRALLGLREVPERDRSLAII